MKTEVEYLYYEANAHGQFDQPSEKSNSLAELKSTVHWATNACDGIITDAAGRLVAASSPRARARFTRQVRKAAGL